MPRNAALAKAAGIFWVLVKNSFYMSIRWQLRSGCQKLGHGDDAGMFLARTLLAPCWHPAGILLAPCTMLAHCWHSAEMFVLTFKKQGPRSMLSRLFCSRLNSEHILGFHKICSLLFIKMASSFWLSKNKMGKMPPRLFSTYTPKMLLSRQWCAYFGFHEICFLFHQDGIFVLTVKENYGSDASAAVLASTACIFSVFVEYDLHVSLR
jgi:hypothetical protein